MTRTSRWEAMEDRARDTLESGGYCDKSHFPRLETDDYLTGYRRDLLQSQPKALELWVEKDALSRLCYEAAYPYCVPVVVARGFASISYLHELAQQQERKVAFLVRKAVEQYVAQQRKNK